MKNVCDRKTHKASLAENSIRSGHHFLGIFEFCTYVHWLFIHNKGFTWATKIERNQYRRFFLEVNEQQRWRNFLESYSKYDYYSNALGQH